MDPVRYQMAGGKDFIAMLGADLEGYDVPHQLVEQLYRDTGVRTNPLRGISFLANKFATEAFIDEIARKHGKDPMNYRLELLKRHAARRHGGRSGWPRWRNWGKKRDGRALGFAFSTIPARKSPASPKYRSIGRAARSRCITSGAPSTAAWRYSPTT